LENVKESDISGGRHRWEGNIKTDIKIVWCKGAKWIELAQHKTHESSFNTLMSLRARYRKEYHDS